MLAEIQLLIEEREVLLRELGVDSIGEFRARRSAGRLPDGMRTADVFLMVDNWGAVRTEMEDADARLADIAARGLGVGVHLVLTASRWMEIRPALRDSIGTRIELRLNDPSESEVNRRLAIQLGGAVPGRGIAPPGVYFQLLLPRMDGQETAEGLGEAQDDLIAKITAGWTGPSAPPVRVLPARLTSGQLRQLSEQHPVAGVPVGIAEADLRPVGIDLTKDESHLLVFGDSGAGKTEFLRRWLTGLTEQYSAWDVRVVLFDYRRTLLGVVPEDHLGAYAGDSTTARVYAEQVCEKLRERLPPPTITPQELRARNWWQGPDIYAVIDDYELIGGGIQAPLAPLVEFVPHARDVGLHLVVAKRVTGSSRLSASDQLLVRLKELGCAGLVLSGDPREGAVIGDQRAQARPPGRGVLVRRGHPGALIQVALEEEVGEYTASAAART
jgi:S-DNA-T family DNA segregation ATPase FtsK/SpoIIIE